MEKVQYIDDGRIETCGAPSPLVPAPILNLVPRGASTAGLYVVHFDAGTGTRTWLLNLNLVSGASGTTSSTAVL